MKPVTSLVLADAPLRAKKRELQALLETRRDEIGALDLEIETLRESLAAFETAVSAQTESEAWQVSRVRGVLDHLERWSRLLRDRARFAERFAARAVRLDSARAKEVRRDDAPPAKLADDAKDEEGTGGLSLEDVLTPRPAADELKTLYRTLARRFHPDLARSEDEHLKFGSLMARINTLYAERDLDRLKSLAEQVKGGEVDDETESLEAQVHALETRLKWFDRVLANLKDERRGMDRYPTSLLMKRAEEAGADAKSKIDFFETLRTELVEDYERLVRDIALAATRLEGEVDRFNKEALHSALEPKAKAELERAFDPFANKSLIRTGLLALKAAQASPAARAKADWLDTLAQENRPLLRLILFAYAVDLATHPLPGLEKLEDLRARLAHVHGDGPAPVLEELLVEAVGVLEYGVRSVNESRMRTGLRFRDEAVREAVPLALRFSGVKDEFRQVLQALGDRGTCEGCGDDVYAVPLFRTRGLDDLRAEVCPQCGHIQRSYWMPKGDDVQSILNDAFLELDVVTEWAFHIERASIALQLLPIQVEEMTVGDLRARFHRDVIEKNGVEVPLEQVSLMHGGQTLDDGTELLDLVGRSFDVAFANDASVTAAEALELIRYRIRHRFRPEGA